MSDFTSLLDHISPPHKLIGVAAVFEDSQTGFIAMAMAEKLLGLGHSCLVVDLNVDHPEIGLLSGVMSSEWDGSIDTLQDAIHHLPNGLDILITSGLHGATFRTVNWIKRLLSDARQHYDHVIVAMPAVLEENIQAADPSTIAIILDTVVLVTVARRDTQSELVQAVNIIRGNNDENKVAGVVINDFANPNLAEHLSDALAPALRNHPLIYQRLRNWFEKVSIFNIPY
ncbi:MAG: hypothetical protein ACSHXK_13245 [Oceanococcus sp.]